MRGVVFGGDFSGTRAFAWTEPTPGRPATDHAQNVYIVEGNATCDDFARGAEGDRRVTSFILAGDGATSDNVDFERILHWHKIASETARPGTLTMLKAATRPRGATTDRGASIGRIRVEAQAMNGDHVSGELDYELCR